MANRYQGKSISVAAIAYVANDTNALLAVDWVKEFGIDPSLQIKYAKIIKASQGTRWNDF